MTIHLLRSLVGPWAFAAIAAAAIPMDATITVNMPSTTGQLLGSFIASTHGLPGTVDTGPFGVDAGPCPATVGPGYVCGRGFASATIDTYLAGTQPTPTQIVLLALKGLAELHVNDAPASRHFEIDAQATARLNLRCTAQSVHGSQLQVNLGYSGSTSVTGGDSRLTMYRGGFSNNPSSCGGVGVTCAKASAPGLDCTTASHQVEIRLEPYVFVRNDSFLAGWSGDMVLDASHTMVVESVDVLDAAGAPIADARAWLDDGTGQPLGYFLRADEVGVVGPIDGTTTTTTVPNGSTTTTTATSMSTTTITTTTTLPAGPPCADLVDLERIVCQCDAVPALPACAGVKPPKSVRGKLMKGCAAGRRAAAASPGSKRTRLQTRAARTLAKVRPALSSPPRGAFTAACRDALLALFR